MPKCSEVSKFKMLLSERSDIKYKNEINIPKRIQKEEELRELQKEIELLKVKIPEEEINNQLKIIDEEIKTMLEKVENIDYNNESYMHKMAKSIVKNGSMMNILLSRQQTV